MKKIALVIDTENWAFARIARDIKKALGEYYEFKIIPIANFDNDVVNVLIEAKDCDLIHFFWRGVLLQINSDHYKNKIEQIGKKIKEFNKRYLLNKIITFHVPDHLFLEKDIKISEKITSEYPNYYVTSNKLLSLYSEMFKNKPYAAISDGVNLEQFYPINDSKFDDIKNRKIKIGWAGNSAWHIEEEDFKGVNTILKPVVKELVTEGYPIEIKYADKAEKIIPYDEMVNFYNDIDVFICTSKYEGTPCTVLEAMACKNVIISTDVGVVKDALGKEQQEFILEKRTKECLKEKIIKLLKNRDLFEKLSNENLEKIKEWNVKLIYEKIKEFYEYNFRKREEEERNKMANLTEEQKKYLENLENRITELERENSKYKLQLEEANYENNYMKSNIKRTNKELKKIKSRKIYKILKLLSKIKNKIFFWRGK